MSDEKYRVLILDDDYELGELLREYLQNTKKCVVSFVTTEADFWQCLSDETFDILFLDYKLPTTNGLDILMRMGQAGINIPTVMMTGEGSENIAARAIQSGALDYLVKGEYSFTSLPPLIQKAVRLREMQRAMQQYLGQIRYQALLLDNMRDAVVVWGLDGIITYWNTAADQLYGAASTERLGKSVEDVYFPSFSPPMPQPAPGATGNFQLEQRFKLPGGKRIWVSTHLTTLYNEGNVNEPIGYMNVARDITPRKQEQEALIKSENFVKRILDTSPNIIFILDLRSQRIHYINPEVTPILGYRVEDFLNSPFQTFAANIHPQDLPAVTQHLRDLQALKDGKVLEIEYRFRSKGNGWRWLKSRDTIFSHGEAGTAAETIGVIQDITASKLAEEKLQRRLSSEKLLSTISNNFINLARPETDRGVASAMQLVAGFIQVDYGSISILEDGRPVPYYSCSSPLAPGQTEGGKADPVPAAPFQTEISLTGMKTAWLLGKMSRHEMAILNSLADLPVEASEDRELFQSMGLDACILIPMIYNNSLYGILEFGSTRRKMNWTEDDIYMLKTFSEMITNALVQKQVDQALRISEARYRAIVEDHQTEMICRFLPDTTLTFVNEAYCRYYQLDRGQLTGASFLDPVPEQEKAPIRALLASLSTDAAVKIFIQPVRLPSGEFRWQEWVSRAIFDQHNDFIEFQAVGRDITERKQMEEQIKAAQTHLTQAARLASIGELASSVAHQISNPLTTIIADAQILSQQLGRNHPSIESARAIIQAGWRAQAVINELMKFSQPAQNTFEPVSINETIEKALLLASAHIQALGVQINEHLQPDLPAFHGNPRQLTDVWVNLLLLARSSFNDGAAHTITIVSRALASGAIIVSITDDGIPIPHEQYDTIFEPQLIPSGAGRGTGMELSICREILRQHRGQISVSGNGHETTFHVSFSAEGM